MAGRQCAKRLWLQVHQPNLATQLTVAERARISTGRELGKMAQELFPAGKLVSTESLESEAAIRKTRALIEQGETVLFEAAFASEDLFARCDILVREADGWHLIEVKSATRVKDQHYDDLAFQALVVTRAGLDVVRCSVCHVNSSEPLGDASLRPDQLMMLSEVTEVVRTTMSQIEAALPGLLSVLAADEAPQIATNTHCNNPVKCSFYAHCHAAQPEHDLTLLPGVRPDKVKAWREAGYLTIDQLPDTEKLSAQQQRMRTTILFNTNYVGDDLATELGRIEFPAHFIDFEAAGPVFARHKGMRPYQQYPFQWSDHFLTSPNGEAQELGFLHTLEDDPRPLFAHSLYEAIKDARTIVFYSPYESTAVKSLAEANVPYGEELVQLLRERGFDLLKVVREHVYFPAFRGSFSIKKVLPALVPGLDYKDLGIADGDTAAVEYLRMHAPTTSPEDRQAIADALRQYCSRDTLAMVELYRALHKLSKPPVTF